MLYLVPPAIAVFANQYYGDAISVEVAKAMTITSPFAANLLIPLPIDGANGSTARFFEQFAAIDLRQYWHFGGYVLFTVILNGVLLGVMVWMFNSRWRVAKISNGTDRDKQSLVQSTPTDTI